MNFIDKPVTTYDSKFREKYIGIKKSSDEIKKYLMKEEKKGHQKNLSSDL